VATASYGMAQPRLLIHVDADPSVFDRNVHAALTVQADAAAFLKGLLGCGRLEPRRADPARLGSLRAAHQAIRHAQAIPGHPGRVQPAVLFAAVHRVCGPETIFVADSGNGLFLAMEHLRLDHPRSFLGPVDYSCMGYSVPAAIGASLATDRPVAAFVGDGAFLMTGLEMLTAASRGAGVLFFLLRDRELSQIAQFQRVALGRQTCTVLGAYDACALAQGLGLETLKLERDGDVEAAVRQAFAWSLQGKPVLVEVAIDYSKPTYFSQGVVATNFLRLPWPGRIRMVARILKRKALSAAGLSRPEAGARTRVGKSSR
jgi:acetolactate synthase-1/2/3 large subunit